MTKPTLAQGWTSFCAAIMPKDAPEVQVLEMKKAFYAGAHVTLMSLAGTATEDMSDEEGAEYFQSLIQEGIEFAQSLLPDNDTESKFEWH